MTALSTTEALWYSALHEPHEDAPWLALADALEEEDSQSSQDRAGLIRAMVELERLEPRKRLTADRAGIGDAGGNLHASRGGPDYYEFTLLRDEAMVPGDRVDYPEFRGERKKPKWAHGLRVVRIVDDGNIAGRTAVVCRDSLSVPWPGEALSSRIEELKAAHVGPKATGERWDRMPCPNPKCKDGWEILERKGSTSLSVGCQTCIGGAGDLMSTQQGLLHRPLSWHRGLLLVGATLEEAVREEECPMCNGDGARRHRMESAALDECKPCSGTGRVHVPTPWSAALLGRWDVALMVEGVEPRHISDSLGEGWAIPRRSVPSWLWQLLPSGDVVMPINMLDQYKHWNSPAAAKLELNLALTRHLRANLATGG